MDSNIYIIRLDSVKRKIVQNLVELELLPPDGAQYALDVIGAMRPDEMLTALVDSEKMRRESPSNVRFFPVDVREISLS